MMTRDEYGDAYQGGFIRTVKFLVHRGVPRAVAPEVAQSAWATGWEKLGQLRSDAMVLVWVNSIAINTYRQRLRGAPVLEDLSDLPGPDQNLAWIEVVQLLRLCQPCERVLLERQLMGETPSEIANSCGVTQTAMRLRLLRARRRIRSQMEMRWDSVNSRTFPERGSDSHGNEHSADEDGSGVHSLATSNDPETFGVKASSK
jgi:DNA-directed RNA polymerase specialized sigma24 family protein